jgi:hypothetical protein
MTFLDGLSAGSQKDWDRFAADAFRFLKQIPRTVIDEAYWASTNEMPHNKRPHFATTVAFNPEVILQHAHPPIVGALYIYTPNEAIYEEAAPDASEVKFNHKFCSTKGGDDEVDCKRIIPIHANSMDAVAHELNKEIEAAHKAFAIKPN